MAVRIVTIGKSNAHRLATVAEEVFDHPIDDARLAAYADHPQHLLCVALRDDLVVGQARAIVHSHPDKAPDLYIDNLGIAPAYRRQGLATRLLAEIVRLGRERGCRELWVCTEQDNESACGLYRSLGWRMQMTVVVDEKL
jgi:aminoglycoside 6'-N-acetyltransferase I